jgi:hypothetical protein
MMIVQFKDRLIVPKIYIPEISAPLIFLAGPIGSAPDWQSKAVLILLSHSRDSGLIIASPRREHELEVAKCAIIGDNGHFPRQRAWERHYLDVASRAGAIMFWLPGEEIHDPKKVYGAMTRMELGQWMTNYRHDGSVRMVVGGDGRFPEMHTIEYDLSLDMPGKRIYGTLEDTCDAALALSGLLRK